MFLHAFCLRQDKKTYTKMRRIYIAMCCLWAGISGVCAQDNTNKVRITLAASDPDRTASIRRRCRGAQ